VVAVDLGARRNQDALAEPACVIENILRALHVRDHRANWVLDDQPYADRGREVVDDLALVDQLVYNRRGEHRVHDQVEARVLAKVVDVLEAARRKVVESVDLPAGVEQALAQVRPDEPRAAGDECLGTPTVHGESVSPPHRHHRGKAPRALANPSNAVPRRSDSPQGCASAGRFTVPSRSAVAARPPPKERRRAGRGRSPPSGSSDDLGLIELCIG
jgi:hypothetical protein